VSYATSQKDISIALWFGILMSSSWRNIFQAMLASVNWQRAKIYVEHELHVSYDYEHLP
jgi:hypothetical protein